MNNIQAFLKSTPFKKFKQNKLGMICLMFIFLMIGISLLAYIIAPDKTQHANWGDLSIKSRQPGFEVLILKVPIANAPEFDFSEYFFGQKNRFYYYPIQHFEIQGNKLLYTPYSDNSNTEMVKEVFLSDFRSGITPTEIEEEYIRTQKFYLGTDKSGRDYLSRMIVGSRISLSIGFVAVFISLVVGLFFGSI